jgi:hypothetical protein
MSWQNLEEMMEYLLVLDKAMTIPGSGNGKGEEDVIGLSTITQCKYSGTKNVTILRKDIDRLLEAAELQRKIPVFVTENNGLKLISIPDTIISKDVLNLIIGMSLTRFVQANVDTIKTDDQKIEYRNLLTRSNDIIGAMAKKYEKLQQEVLNEVLTIEISNNVQTNLFD